MYLNGIESLGRKIITLADKVQEGAARVSGAVKGAAVGAQTAPAHPYLKPALIGGAVALAILAMGRKS